MYIICFAFVVSLKRKQEVHTMKTANVNIRITPELKSAVENLYAEFGMSLSDAVNIFFHKSLLVGGLPFDLRQPRYNAEVEAAMQEAREIKAGRREAKVYTSIEDFKNDL